jgi:hypothetical protein
MKLSISERLSILNKLCATPGSFVDLCMGDSIRERIKFEPKEIEKIGLQDVVDPATGAVTGIKWNQNAVDSEFNIGASEIAWLKKKLAKLDEASSIPTELFQLCKKVGMGE